MNEPLLILPLEKCYNDSPSSIGYRTIPDSPAVAAVKVKQAGEWASLDEQQRQVRTNLRASHERELLAAGLAEEPAEAPDGDTTIVVINS